MLSNILTMSLSGLEGYLVNVEVDINFGMPSWEIVGLPDVTVRESKERIRTAIKNSGYSLLSRKIVINLAPAFTRKEGSSFDLPIAMGVLSSLGNVNINNALEYIFIGELSLDGKLNKVNGILPMCVDAFRLGIKKVIVPFENRLEAAVVNGLEIFPAKTLREVIDHINNVKSIDVINEEYKEIITKNSCENVDFSDVKGQENVKRAIEVAAAGGHNCLLIGSPGVGKTMISRRIPTILPDFTFDEALETTKIHSIAGLLPKNKALITSRPFRAPHHTTTSIALTGGGRNPKPGEISLAHNGVLFLDELPEFDRKALEVMRGPLEDKKITISRMNSTFTYPCNFMFVASMNPCPCGYANDPQNECSCSQEQITRYLKRISGPLIDRIDIHVEVGPVEYSKLQQNHKAESSLAIKERVNKARKKQIQRYKKYGIKSNSELTGKMIDEFCVLKSNAKGLIENAFEKLNLSVRAYTRILKVARTIADLADSKEICANHIAEAIQYRSLDRKFK